MLWPMAKNFKALPTPDKYGRWAEGMIADKTDAGLGKRRLAAIAAYRPPARSLTAGCLVTRVAVGEKLKTAKQVHEALHAGLGKLIEDI